MVWSQTNRVFKIKTMRFFGWNIWDAAAIGWFSCIQCRGEKRLNSTEISERTKWMQYNEAEPIIYVRTRTWQSFMSNWKQSHTKYEVVRRFVCIFFLLSKMRRKKSKCIVFRFSRLFFISLNVSLCTLIKKYTLNRTNNHGQRRQSWQKKTESVQHLFK